MDSSFSSMSKAACYWSIDRALPRPPRFEAAGPRIVVWLRVTVMERGQTANNAYRLNRDGGVVVGGV